MSDLNVTLSRLTVSSNDVPRVGPFVSRDRQGITIGFSRNWAEHGHLTPIAALLESRCTLPPEHDDRIEGAILFTMDEARIILRGLQEVVTRANSEQEATNESA